MISKTQPKGPDGEPLPWIEVPGSLIAGATIAIGVGLCVLSAVAFWSTSQDLRYLPESARNVMAYSVPAAILAGGITTVAIGAILRDLRRLLWVQCDERQRQSFF